MSEKKYKAKKHFGQNFLQDHNIINNIISNFSPKESDNIVEIGPGLGALTKPLLNKVTKLNLVEVDKELAGKLIEQYNDRINLYNSDILKFDLNSIINLDSPNGSSTPVNKLRIIGNLPYNISTPILFHLFKYIDNIQDMMFMLQLEVIDRIIAKPNTKDYGRLSVMAQYFCDAQKLFTIPPTAFHPQPKVYSAIVYLKPKSLEIRNKLKNLELFSNIVQAAFNQRRKSI